MDITPTTTILPANPNPPPPVAAKSPEPEPETPTRIQPIIKQLSFSNGVLKRHHQHHHNQHVVLHHGGHVAAPVVVTYKECLKNHAAAMGVHSVDGCGEFMPSPSATNSDPTSLKCAACGCHRNFHRREPDLDHHLSPSPPLPPPPPAAAIEYRPHHRHHPPPPPPQPPTIIHRGSPTSSSPPPISSSYAPHMLLALSTGSEPSPRKRFRTKFSPAQKEQMFQFAERLGWKMQKRDEDLIQEFCNETRIDKGVLKVWMHNNKNTFSKRVLLDTVAGVGGANNGAAHADRVTNKVSSNGTSEILINNLNNNHHHDDDDDDEDEEDLENGIDRRQLQFGVSVAGGGAANGGSSSSS